MILDYQTKKKLGKWFLESFLFKIFNIQIPGLGKKVLEKIRFRKILHLDKWLLEERVWKNDPKPLELPEFLDIVTNMHCFTAHFIQTWANCRMRYKRMNLCWSVLEYIDENKTRDPSFIITFSSSYRTFTQILFVQNAYIEFQV